MKNTIFLLFILVARFSAAAQDDFLNPTGTYILKGVLTNRKIVSHSGELRVKFLGKGRVAFSFFISNGYPGYEWASFCDTTDYRDNEFTYQPRGCSDCTILFSCTHRQVETQNLLTNPLSNCGFGAGVVVPAFYDKISSDNPVIKDLSMRGKSN